MVTVCKAGVGHLLHFRCFGRAMRDTPCCICEFWGRVNLEWSEECRGVSKHNADDEMDKAFLVRVVKTSSSDLKG